MQCKNTTQTKMLPCLLLTYRSQMGLSSNNLVKFQWILNDLDLFGFADDDLLSSGWRICESQVNGTLTVFRYTLIFTVDGV